MAAGSETSSFPTLPAGHESNRQLISQLKPLPPLENKPVPSNQRDLLTGDFPSRQSAQSGDFQQARQKPSSAAPKSPGLKKLPSIQELQFSLGGIMLTTSNESRAMLKTNRLETFIVKTGSQIRVIDPGEERTFSVEQIESSSVLLRDLKTKKQIRVD
ncbi:MAG: hypothetical protein VX768_04895 [Planctomycetota bacterium]|nr:hypothetical protein [Planctomycetota bacterium]